MAFKDYEKILPSKNDKQYNEIKENWEFIDTIDFLPYIRKNETVEGIILRAENDYKCILLPKCCESFLFNWITTSEFASYLENRYSNILSINEVVDTTYYINQKIEPPTKEQLQLEAFNLIKKHKINISALLSCSKTMTYKEICYLEDYDSIWEGNITEEEYNLLLEELS